MSERSERLAASEASLTDLAERSEAPNPGDQKWAEPPFLAAPCPKGGVAASLTIPKLLSSSSSSSSSCLSCNLDFDCKVSREKMIKITPLAGTVDLG